MAREPKSHVTTREGELPEGTARVETAPGFLKGGREGFAGLFTFLLQQAAEQGGFPPELLQRLFGRGFATQGFGGGRGGEPVIPPPDESRVGRGERGETGFTPATRGEQPGEIPDIPLLPTLPGLPDFLEGQGRGPNVAAAVAIPAAASVFGTLFGPGGLARGGGPDQPSQVVGGDGGITPIFPDINQEQLQLFLQLLQSMNTGGPAAALGPNPLTADVAGLLPPPEDLGIIPQPIAAVEPPPVETPIVPPPVIPEPPPVETVETPGAPPVIPEPPPVETPLVPPPPEGGNGEVPTEVPDTQGDQLQNFLSQIQSGNMFQDLAQFFSLPTFEGPFTTPATDLQRQALGASSEFLGTDLGERNEVSQKALQEFIESGGGRFDLSPQFSALEAVNKRRLDEQRAALNEQFGVLGARFGTDIARGQGELSSRFLEAEAAQRAEIAGQSFREQQERRLGGLRLGEEGRRTDITGREQRGREITEGFRLGEAERQIGDTAVQRQLAEFARTQGALLPMLLQFFGQGLGPEEIVLPPE